MDAATGRKKEVPMIFDMPSCGGCRTCEIACSFKQREEFIPTISSIKILEKEDGPGYLVFIAEEEGGPEITCDGCKELGVPMCMQYCPKSKDLEKILEEFMREAEKRRGEKKGSEASGGI
jgi:Fe-S-cluster-containing dehydrogenase component